jgi:hypothetical protein
VGFDRERGAQASLGEDMVARDERPQYRRSPFCKRELCIWKPSIDEVVSIGTAASVIESRSFRHTRRGLRTTKRDCLYVQVAGRSAVELQRAEVKEVMRRQNVYKSAIMEALGKIACIRVEYIIVSIIVSFNEENNC